MQKSARAQAEQLGRSWLQALVFNINFISKFLCALVLHKEMPQKLVGVWISTAVRTHLSASQSPWYNSFPHMPHGLDIVINSWQHRYVH